MSEITLKHSPLYASLPTIYDHHDQLWAATPSHFLDHLYDDFDYWVDDVWLSSYPRSGTAWTYEVLYAVLYDGDIAALQYVQSEGKILKFLPIEIGSAAGVSERITTWKALPSPRVIPTHVPFRLYPQTVLERHCKRVYVVRNPKDVAVSFYHHHVGSKNASLLDRAQDAVNVHSLGEIFQVFVAESFHLIAITQAADGLWTDQELTGLGSGCQACRQVGDRTACRKGPAGPLHLSLIHI